MQHILPALADKQRYPAPGCRRTNTTLFKLRYVFPIEHSLRRCVIQTFYDFLAHRVKIDPRAIARTVRLLYQKQIQSFVNCADAPLLVLQPFDRLRQRRFEPGSQLFIAIIQAVLLFLQKEEVAVRAIRHIGKFFKCDKKLIFRRHIGILVPLAHHLNAVTVFRHEIVQHGKSAVHSLVQLCSPVLRKLAVRRCCLFDRCVDRLSCHRQRKQIQRENEQQHKKNNLSVNRHTSSSHFPAHSRAYASICVRVL